MARRHVLAGLLASLSTGSRLVSHAAHAASSNPRVAALDWSLVEVALAVGITPVAASEAAGYRQWVSVPQLPPNVPDLGLRVQPNLELLQLLRPDLILTIPERGDLAVSMQRIAPPLSLPIYTNDFTAFSHACAVTRELGQRAGLEAAANAAVDRAESAIAAGRAKLPADPPPVLVIRFVDARNVFVFGRGGLFDDVIVKMGMRNGWSAPPSRFGFTRTSLLSLAQADAASHLYIVNPALPADVIAMMQSDPIWLAMPFARRGAVTRLPPVWFFGATEAAARFATMLADAITAPPQAVLHAG